jgi:DNA-binding response OmpR family regulator
MFTERTERPTVLVISDDEELGGLLALNLRRRSLVVEHTDFGLAASPSWAPANGRPIVVVMNVEKTSTNSLAFLRATRLRAWLREVPIILAADGAPMVIARLGGDERILPTKLDDVGAIVTAALRLVADVPASVTNVTTVPA